MPLLAGKSKKTMQKNRKELFSSAKRKGKIGNINLSKYSKAKRAKIVEAVVRSKARGE